jgi:hypothetical protein
MWTIRRITVIAVVIVMMLVTPYIVMNLTENLSASEIMVVQSPVSGDLACYTDPGVKWQGFGAITKYPRRDTYEFATDGKIDTSKKLRFNDGGHANLYGSVSWEMPLDCPSIINIHKTFGSKYGVENAAVSKMIDSAVYLAGPLMSSTESSGERRADLVQYINDQAERGVYVTQVVDKEVTDPLSGQKKEIQLTVRYRLLRLRLRLRSKTSLPSKLKALRRLQRLNGNKKPLRLRKLPPHSNALLWRSLMLKQRVSTKLNKSLLARATLNASNSS